MNIFLARQPIFDRNLQVIAYELLFRDGVENLFTATDKCQATSFLMADSLLHFEVDKLTDGKKAFINSTREIDCLCKRGNKNMRKGPAWESVIFKTGGQVSEGCRSFRATRLTS